MKKLTILFTLFSFLIMPGISAHPYDANPSAEREPGNSKADDSDKVLYIIGGYGLHSENGVELRWLAPTETNREILDENYKLFNHGDGKFSRTFFVDGVLSTDYPSESPQFFFYTALKGWDATYCIGAGMDEFGSTPIVVRQGVAIDPLPMVAGGAEVWSLILVEDVTGSLINFEVDLNNMTLHLTRVSSGIEDVYTSEEFEEEWYTLEGLKVSNPKHGTFIHLINGKVEKTVLK